MKRVLFVTGALVILTIISIGIYYTNTQSQQKPAAMKDSSMMQGKDDAMMKKDETVMEPTGTTGSSEQDMMMKKGAYIPFRETVLADTKDTKRVLFFYANWCPTCRPVNIELEENEAKIPEGVSVIRVNYNDTDTDQVEKDLAKQYGVTYQHTFVLIDENDHELKQWNGGGLDEIVAMTK